MAQANCGEDAEADVVARQGGAENQVAESQVGDGQDGDQQVAVGHVVENRVVTTDADVGHVKRGTVVDPGCGVRSTWSPGAKDHTSPLTISGWSAMSCQRATSRA